MRITSRIAQAPKSNIGLAVRTAGHPADITNAIQRALATVDPELKPFDVFTLSERVELSLNQRRTPMLLSLAFGLVALLLASVGLYGVLAYQVAQRTREIGIRMALGSDRAGIIGLVLREGAALVVAGLAAGALGAVLLRTFIRSQLYGVGAFDPLVMLTVVAVLRSPPLRRASDPRVWPRASARRRADATVVEPQSSRFAAWSHLDEARLEFEVSALRRVALPRAAICHSLFPSSSQSSETRS